jgi:hypothetical protein
MSWTKAERPKHDAVQSCYWINSQLKRWLLGTLADAVSAKHLQAYLDEFAFRYNRRYTKGAARQSRWTGPHPDCRAITKGVVRIAARVIGTLVSHAALPM